MSNMNLSFTDWAYPTKKPKKQFLAMSPSGLIAHSIDDILTIYCESPQGYEPIISWKPFDRPISAITWHDAVEIPDMSLPILTMASESGKVCVHDLCARKNIAAFTLKNDKATVIKWSPISSSRFFVGTQEGNILCCYVVLDRTVKFKFEWKLHVNFPVNFLTIEPSFGDTLAVGSNSGKLAFINRVHSSVPFLESDIYILIDNDNEIYSSHFLESSSNYMIFVTKNGTLLYMINEKSSITLFNDIKLRELYEIPSHGRRLIGLNDETIAMYEFINGKIDRISEISVMPSVSNLPQHFSTKYVYKNDKIVFVSWNWWLTTVKIVGNKLFVTNRVKLLNDKPLYTDFINGSMIFCTKSGSVCSTRQTPSSLIKAQNLQMQANELNSSRESLTESSMDCDSSSGEVPEKKQRPPIPSHQISDRKSQGDISPPSLPIQNKLSMPSQKAINLSNVKNLDQISHQTVNLRRRVSVSLKYAQNAPQNTASNSEDIKQTLNEGFDIEMGDDFGKKISESAQAEFSNKAMERISQRFARNQAVLNAHNDTNQEMKSAFATHTEENKEKHPRFSQEGVSTYPKLPEINNTHPHNNEKKISFVNVSDQAPIFSVPKVKGLNHHRSMSMHQATTKPNEIASSNSRRIYSSDQNFDSGNQLCAYGNSRTFNYSFKLCDIPLERVVWVSYSKFVTWGSIEKGNRHISRFFLVDIKTRSVYPILEKRLATLNMPVTSVIVSNTRRILCIILSKTLVNFVSLRTSPPTVIGSLNMKKKSLVSFSPKGDQVSILSGSIMLITRDIYSKADKNDQNSGYVIETEQKIIIEKAFDTGIKGKFTAFLWIQQNAFILGTEEGKLFLVTVPLHVEEITKIQNPVKSFSHFLNKRFMVTDSKNNMYIVALNEDLHGGKIEATFPIPVKFIRNATPNDFIVRPFHKGRLSSLRLNGLPPPTIFSPAIKRCMIMKPPETWTAMLKEAMKTKELTAIQIAEQFGMPLMRNILVALDNPDFTREQITLIRDILTSDTDLNNLSIHLCLDLGEIDRARDLSFKTVSSSPFFVLNLFKAVLFESSPKLEIVYSAVATLITEGKENDAIDLLLILNLVKDAIEKLIAMDELKEAQCIVKIRLDETEESMLYMKDVAKQIIESGRLGAGFILLALSGGFDQLKEQFISFGENEQAEFIDQFICS